MNDTPMPGTWTLQTEGRLAILAAVFGLAVAAAASAQGPATPFRTLAPALDPAARPYTAFDADGDGDLDLLTSKGLLLNDGGGRFAASAGALPPTINPNQIILASAADMDGDGDQDLVVVWAPSAVLGEVYWNAGGVFATSTWLAYGPSYYSNVTTPAALVLGDFDGNGLRDVAGPSLGLRFHLQTAPGVFVDATASILTAAGNPGPGLRLLGGTDLNADGFIDLLCDASGTSVLFTGSASGLSAAAVPAGFIGNPTSAAVGDFDGDGRDDFVVSKSSFPFGPLDEFVFSTGGGGPYAIGVSRTEAARLGAIDVDGDGRDDVLRFTATGVVGVDYLTGAPRTAPPIADVPATSLGGIATISPRFLVFDADQDGDADVAGMRAANVYALALRTTAGAFRLEEGTFTMAAGGAGAPVVADFDQDGDLDLARAAAPGGASSLVLRRNDGKGRFGDPAGAGTIERATMGPSVTGDFDGDGDLDVFEFNGPASPILHIQGPPGQFFATTLVGIFGGTTLVASVVDVDADGDLDIQVVGSFGILPVQGLHRYLNAAGTFSGPVLVAPFSVTRADSLFADADAIPDFAVTSNATPNAYVISVVSGANGAVLAVLGTIPFSTAYTGAIAAGDLDNDGDTDVMAETTAYLASGLVYAPIPAPGPAPLAISARVRFVRDVDGDGIADVLEVSAHDGTVYYGLAGPTFGPGVPFLATYGSGVVTVADFDRDGDPDLIDRAGRLLTNVTAHAASGRTAAIGRTASIELYGAASAPFELFASLTVFTQNPLAIPGWGNLWLDPTAAVYAGAGTLDATGRSELSFGVPNTPALAGVTLWWQAALPATSRLTGVARNDFYLP